MTFGEKLKNLRHSRFITQQKLADGLNISQSAVAAYEGNIREPDFATVKKIADYFHVSASSLMPSDADDNADFVQQVADAVQQNGKIQEIFDNLRYMAEPELDAVLVVVKALRKQE